MRFEGLGDVAAERATSLISQIKEIFIAQHAVDFRKGFNGLLAECYNMEIDPYKDECVVFVHRWWRQVLSLVTRVVYFWFTGVLMAALSRRRSHSCVNQVSCASLS
jgi:hypothetical protein